MRNGPTGIVQQLEIQIRGLLFPREKRGRFWRTQCLPGRPRLWVLGMEISWPVQTRAEEFIWAVVKTQKQTAREWPEGACVRILKGGRRRREKEELEEEPVSGESINREKLLP